MPLILSSANMVALIMIKDTGAIHRIQFTKPPKNGNCWTIGSARTADVSIGQQTQGLSGKHLGLGFGQDGMVITKIFSSDHTELSYHSVSGDEKVDGNGSQIAPAWAVPVGQRIEISLGRSRNLELNIQAFNHGEHLNDYLKAVERFKASAPKDAEPTQPQPRKGAPPSTPAPGVATFLSGALGGMEIATPAVPGGTEMPSLTDIAYENGMYTHSFLEVTPKSNQMRPGSEKVVKVRSTKTWNVHAAKYFDKGKEHLLNKEAGILTDAKATKAPHIIMHFESFPVSPRINKQHMLVTEWCDLGSMVEEGKRKPFTYRETGMIVHQVAKALKYLHSQRFVHRDVRPRHILVRSRTTSHIEVCLTGFSSSAKFPIVTDATDITDLSTATQASIDHYFPRGWHQAEDEVYIAPDAFASPDQLPKKHVKHLAAVDIWSLSVIALELLTGSLPTIAYETAQDRQHPIQVRDQKFTKALIDHKNEMAMTPAATATAYSGLVPFIMGMLRPSPDDRMTAQELVDGTANLVYPDGRFPAVAAPRIHAYDLWRGGS